MQITHLGSGSRGNSTLICSSETRVLVDCGFSLRQTEKRLSSIGIDPKKIDSIVVTHNHKDHSGSASNAAKKWDSELYCNAETAIRMGWKAGEDCNIFGSLERVSLGSDLSVMPISVPHDESDNVAILARDDEGGRAAVVTDLGEATDDLIGHLRSCGHISIEANYDHSKLMSGPYPESLKRRISGRGGHLSNAQTAEILNEICSSKLDSIVLCHLSEKNNAPHIAESEVLMSIGDEFSGDISISKQMGPEFSHWTGQSDPEKYAIA